MSSSATDISKQVGQANNVVQSAESKVEATNNEFIGLSNAARKIGDVIKLIQTIAGQTNLLALNATIEAAEPAKRGVASLSLHPKSKRSPHKPARQRKKSLA